jgi:hypothetical protein
MYEVYGRAEKRFNVKKILRLHRASGLVYFLIFLFISYLCLSFIIQTGSELSPRGVFHMVFAMGILIIFFVKLLVIKVYRQFYNHARVFGLLIFFLHLVFSGHQVDIISL